MELPLCLPLQSLYLISQIFGSLVFLLAVLAISFAQEFLKFQCGPWIGLGGFFLAILWGMRFCADSVSVFLKHSHSSFTVRSFSDFICMTKGKMVICSLMSVQSALLKSWME